MEVAGTWPHLVSEHRWKHVGTSPRIQLRRIRLYTPKIQHGAPEETSRNWLWISLDDDVPVTIARLWPCSRLPCSLSRAHSILYRKDILPSPSATAASSPSQTSPAQDLLSSTTRTLKGFTRFTISESCGDPVPR